MLLGTLECDGGVRRRAGPLRPLARTRGDRVPAANNRRAKRGSIRCAKGGADKWHQATCPQVLNLTLTYNEDPVGPFPGQVIDMRSGSAGDLTRRATGVTPAEHQTFVGGNADVVRGGWQRMAQQLLLVSPSQESSIMIFLSRAPCGPIFRLSLQRTSTTTVTRDIWLRES